ncbi:hypothetical protein [Streptococcus ruminantium]|uniref:hypothetical protein n=1 Tax=Streptococcus ruminantium TaxID=1917441 RepID=UPI0012DF5F99|nr:hypothetical protein [Streptococcus ruminantium]BDD42150.1 hypothetical protein GUT189_04830 [Streptococcus ruminantium]
MSKCKIASVAILAAFSLFATASVSANEVVTVTRSSGTPFKYSDPCTVENKHQEVRSNKFINIAPPGGRGTEGSKWSEEWINRYLEQSKTSDSVIGISSTLGLGQSFVEGTRIF